MDSSTTRAIFGVGAVGVAIASVFLLGSPLWESHQQKKHDEFFAKRRLSLARRFPPPTRKHRIAYSR